MNKVNGILMLLIYICVGTALLNEVFVEAGNLSNVVRRTALFGVIGIGVAFVIITGGIDLSIGSMIGLTGCLLAMFLEVEYRSLDRVDLVQASNGSEKIVVAAGDLEWGAGDRVALFDGKSANQGVFELQDAPQASRSESQSDTELLETATLTVNRSIAEDDRNGKVQRVFSIDRVDREYNEIIVSDFPLKLKPRDRVVFFSEGFQRPQTISIFATYPDEEGRTVIGLDSTPDGFSERGHFAVETRHALPIWIAIVIVMAVSVCVGLTHGLLVTKVGLQPFVVTLCGLLIYRGIARTITREQSQGFGNEYEDSIRLLATGQPMSAAALVALVGIGLALICAYRIARSSWASRREQLPVGRSWSHGFGLGLGVLLAVIGSSRYWQGAPVGGETVPPGSDLPTLLCAWLGWLFIPFAVFFLGWAWSKNRTAMMWPTVMLAGSAGLFAAGLFVADRAQPWFGEAQWVNYFRMSMVFIPLALVFAALSSVARTALRVGGNIARPLGATTAVFGIMMLAGQTEFFLIMIPAPFFILILLGAAAAVFLNLTIYGRYLLALGRNEQAARFSGINTDRMIILAYVICSSCAGLGGILFALDLNSIQPAQHGNFYELYAIAAAVLGGCSLRGGEGTIMGVIIGAAVMRVLRNSIGLIDIPPQLEYSIIGAVILIGVIVDEVGKRMARARRLSQQRQG